MRVMTGLAIAVLWATPAAATDWFLVAASADTATFVDRDSIADIGPALRRASIVQVFSQTESDGAAAYAPLLEFDCDKPRYRFVSIKTLDIDGNVMSDDVGSGKWRDVTEDSLDGIARNFVCTGGAEPDHAVSYGDVPLIPRGRELLQRVNTSKN